MLELFSLLGGGFIRLIPELLSFFKSKQDNDHEFRMSELQLEIDKERAKNQLDLAHVQAETVVTQFDYQALSEAVKAQSTPSGIKWIDGLSSSVRPVLTYWWCIVLYTIYKSCIIYNALMTNITITAFASVVFTEFDSAVMSSIIAFWFVDRALRKLR